MKTRLSFIKTCNRLASIFTAINILFILMAGCGQRERRISLSVSDLEARQPFVATVDFVYVGRIPQTNLDLRDTVSIGLQMQSGERIAIGDSGSNVDLLLGFARTLKKGGTYEFPHAWLEYLRKTNSLTGK